jgi:alpha-tubulin suppressor-like RCC1 family protein
MSKSIMGKAAFAKLQDSKGRIQVYVQRDAICPDENKDLYSFDMKTDKSRKLLGGVCDISVGNWVNGAVTEDGKLYLWGENAGHYVAGSSPVNEPTEYKSDVHWVDIESGLQYLLLLDDKGNVYESRTTEDTYPIKKIDALKDIESIYCCSEKIAVSKNGHINYWKGDFGSDRYNSSKKIESVLNGLKPTSFRLGAEYSVAVVGDEAYFWGCFGPSKYNKGMDDVLSPKYDSGLTDFDDICCGSFTYVRKGKTVRIYKR